MIRAAVLISKENILKIFVLIKFTNDDDFCFLTFLFNFFIADLNSSD